jgi:hypothetical protein
MLGLILAAAVATAANAPPQAMLGRWDFGRDGEGADSCVITLGPEPVIGGFRLTAPKACAKITPQWDDLYAWRMDAGGDLVFADPTRKGVIRLSRSQGAWSSQTYLMSRPGKPLTQAERMRGHWRLVAFGGDPLCDFDITSNAGGTAGTLKGRGACKAPWAGRAFSAWALKGRRITLSDTAGKPVVSINDCGLGGCVGELPNGDFIGFTPIFE